jgi:hypothetical protein
VATTGAGKLEFERSWGKRKNEDNWRRSVKSTVISEDTYREPGMDLNENFVAEPGMEPEQKADKASAPTSGATTLATRESLLADIPLTDNAKQSSHSKIEEALYESADQMFSLLSDYRSAADQFERLLREYPASKNRENTLIGLYQSYSKLDDKTNMARVKNIITSEYPNSLFASYLNDPQFLEKREIQRAETEKHYQDTYDNYLMGNYALVLERTNNIPEGRQNQYSAKYELLKALSFAKSGESAPFGNALRTIVSDYKGSEEAELASAMLAELEKGRQPVKAEPYKSAFTNRQASNTQTADIESAGASFVYSPYESHSVIFVTDKNTNLNMLQYSIADFNFGRFLVADYSIEFRPLPDGTMLLLVGGLKNKVEAMDYLYVIREQKDIMQRANYENPDIVVASDNNLKEIVARNALKPYNVFFNAYYLSVVKEPEKAAEPKPTEAATPVEPKVVEQTKDKEEPVKNEITTPATQPVEAEPQAEKTIAVEKEEPMPEEEPAEPQIFVEDDGSDYLAVIMIKKLRNDLRRIQTIITNFTVNNYNETIKGEASDMGTTHRVIKVSGFDSKKEAQDYLHKLEFESSLMRNLIGTDNHLLLINETNYNLLMENKKIDQYKSFIAK